MAIGAGKKNPLAVKKRTSIGNSGLSRPRSKAAKRQHKKYRGQGRP